MQDVWDDLPELAPPLIDGVLRQGHKMLVAGPSKAGKSYALIELCCSIAEGKKWMGFNCAHGKVLYVNLELDRASCLHRFKDVYSSLNWQPECLTNIDIWNLRGNSIPMDKLAPKLIRRAANHLQEVLDRCLSAKPVMEWDYTEHEMVETGDWTFDSKGALEAIKLLGQHLGMFSNKLKISADNDDTLKEMMEYFEQREKENT